MPDESAQSGGAVGPAEGESAAELARYRSHLDAHFLKRHQQQQSASGAGGNQYRKWFLCARDWLTYRPEASQTLLPDADTDEREHGAASNPTTTTTPAGEDGAVAFGVGGGIVKSESGLAADPRIDYQPASTDVAEVCPNLGLRSPEFPIGPFRKRKALGTYRNSSLGPAMLELGPAAFSQLCPPWHLLECSHAFTEYKSTLKFFQFNLLLAHALILLSNLKNSHSLHLQSYSHIYCIPIGIYTRTYTVLFTTLQYLSSI